MASQSNTTASPLTLEEALLVTVKPWLKPLQEYCRRLEGHLSRLESEIEALRPAAEATERLERELAEERQRTAEATKRLESEIAALTTVPEGEHWLTIRQVARVLGCCTKTVRFLVKMGEIGAKPGKCPNSPLKISSREIQNYLHANHGGRSPGRGSLHGAEQRLRRIIG